MAVPFKMQTFAKINCTLNLNQFSEVCVFPLSLPLISVPPPPSKQRRPLASKGIIERGSVDSYLCWHSLFPSETWSNFYQGSIAVLLHSVLMQHSWKMQDGRGIGAWVSDEQGAKYSSHPALYSVPHLGSKYSGLGIWLWSHWLGVQFATMPSYQGLDWIIHRISSSCAAPRL